MSVVRSSPEKNQKEIDFNKKSMSLDRYDQNTFQQIYSRWLTPVYRYSFFCLGNSADAEDLTSQVFLAVYQALPRYKHNGHFSGWLFTIAHNQLHGFLHKRAREMPIDTLQDIPQNVDIPAEIASKEEIQHLRKLILALTPDEQELIRLRYVVGLSFADMAVALKRKEDAIKKSLYRLQARLQSLMEDYHG
jgi:RNA polymerase sigma-70 factor (ECF subfamily)